MTQPNPFLDPGPWGSVLVGGTALPGIVRTIDGAEKPEEWTFQKGSGSNNATSVWKGTKLAEAIKIVLEAPDRTSFDALYAMRDALRPKIGKKPPSLAIESPVINFNGITRISSALIGQPAWNEGRCSWTIELTFCEYNPGKKTNAGAAGPAAGATKTPTENDVLADQLAAAMAVAVKV